MDGLYLWSTFLRCISVGYSSRYPKSTENQLQYYTLQHAGHSKSNRYRYEARPSHIENPRNTHEEPLGSQTRYLRNSRLLHDIQLHLLGHNGCLPIPGSSLHSSQHLKRIHPWCVCNRLDICTAKSMGHQKQNIPSLPNMGLLSQVNYRNNHFLVYSSKYAPPILDLRRSEGVGCPPV